MEIALVIITLQNMEIALVIITLYDVVQWKFKMLPRSSRIRFFFHVLPAEGTMGELTVLVVGVIKLMSYKILTNLLSLCRNIMWLCNGTSFKLAETKRDYRTSAHKLHIWSKYYMDILYPVSMTNFILSHEEFVHPEYVFKDTVTLLQITRDMAIFIESGSDNQLASSPDFGFFFVGQM